LERAAVLTPEPAKRTMRALAAAQTKVQAGALDAGLEVLAVPEAEPLGELERARADLVRAQVVWVTKRGSDAPLLLLKAAKRLEPIAPDPARATYVDAFMAAGFAGRFAAPGGSMVDVARQVSAASGHASTASDLLLDGLTANFVREYAASVPILRSALSAFRGEMSADQALRGMPVALQVSAPSWDDDACELLSARWAKSCREAGALSDLPIALNLRAHILLFAGDFAGAASLVEEVRAATDAMGIDFEPDGAMGLAAFRGREAEASPLLEANESEALLRGEQHEMASAVLFSSVLSIATLGAFIALT
jgi:hypothetical protein